MRRCLALGLGMASLLQAQEIRLGGLLTFYHHQSLSPALRTWELRGSRMSEPGTPYLPHLVALRESGFILRRCELYLSGRLTETVSWNVAMDPSFTGSPLSDAALMWSPGTDLSLRLGQMKPPQGYEGSVVPASQLLFYDRSAVARQFSDRWDRGAALTVSRPMGAWRAHLSLGGFNGSGRGADQNPQKDGVFRLEVTGPLGLRGAIFGLEGRTDARGDAVIYPTPVGSGDGGHDLTTALGGYLVQDRPEWHASLEWVAGRLGRRFPVLGPAPSVPALRQHPDQRVLGWVITAVWRPHRDAWAFRWERLDYDAGGHAGSLRSGPAPVFTEAVAGWSRGIGAPARWKTTCLRLNLLRRTGPLLLGPGGAFRTGHSLVAVLQVGF